MKLYLLSDEQLSAFQSDRKLQHRCLTRLSLSIFSAFFVQLRMGEVGTTVVFRIDKEMIVPGILGTSFIESFICSIFREKPMVIPQLYKTFPMLTGSKGFTKSEETEKEAAITNSMTALTISEEAEQLQRVKATRK